MKFTTVLAACHLAFGVAYATDSSENLEAEVATEFEQAQAQLRQKNHRRCDGYKYEWDNVAGYRVCYLHRLRWAPHLGICEWNRERQVPQSYCY